MGFNSAFKGLKKEVSQGKWVVIGLV